MRIRTIHRLARLEVEARPYIQRVRAQKTSDERGLRRAVEHAAVLAFIVRYGKPRIEEPLSRACERCEVSDAWKECCERFPTALGRRHRFVPYERSNYDRIAEPVRYAVEWFFQGTNEKDKLNRLFRSAPPWFLWFTFADYSARALGLSVPDLSSIARFERYHRPLANYDWYDVPEGKFERRLRDNDNDIVQRLPVYVSPLNSEADEEELTHRERQRVLRYKPDRPNDQVDKWPRRSPIEIIELTEEEQDEILASSIDRDVIFKILQRKYPDKCLKN